MLAQETAVSLSPTASPKFGRKSAHFLPLMTSCRLDSATYEHLCSLMTRHGDTLETVMGATSSWVRIPLPPPIVGVKKAPQTEICGASFLAKSSNVDQRVWVTSTFLALYPLMVGNPILRPIPVLGLPRISLTSIPLPQSLFRTAQRCHCCPRATMCTTVHSTQFLRL